MGWTRFDAMFGNRGYFYGDDGGANFIDLGIDGDSVTLLLDLFDGSDHHTTGASLVQHDWYHLAYVKSGNDHKVYYSTLDQSVDCVQTIAVTRALGITPTNPFTFVDKSTRMLGVKMYGEALTVAQIRAERAALTPCRRTNLLACTRLDYVATGLTDISGHARDWIADSSLEDVAGLTLQNDLCADALVIPGLPYADLEDIKSATATAGDPTNSASGAVAFHGVWYKWTAPGNMTVQADLFPSDHGSGSLPNTHGVPYFVLGVFTGSCGGAWTEIASRKESNNYFNAGARVQFAAVSGTTYFFHVGALNAVGLLDAHLTFRLFAAPSAPANDLCGSAINIASLPYHDYDRQTIGATATAGDPIDSIYWGDVLDQTLFYKYTAGTEGHITIDTLGSDYEPIVAVYAAGACGSLSGEVDANGDYTTGSVLVVPVTNGVTYYLLVGSADGAHAGGMLTLNVVAGAPPPPPALDPPTGFAGIATSPYAADFTWDAEASVDKFILEMCTGAGCTGFSEIAEINGNLTSYILTGFISSLAILTPCTIYRFRLIARNGAGDSDPSAVVSLGIPTLLNVEFKVGSYLQSPPNDRNGTPEGGGGGFLYYPDNLYGCWTAQLDLPVGANDLTIFDIIKGPHSRICNNPATPGSYDHDVAQTAQDPTDGTPGPDGIQTPFQQFTWFGVRGGKLQAHVFDGRWPTKAYGGIGITAGYGTGANVVVTAPDPLPSGCVTVALRLWWRWDGTSIGGATNGTNAGRGSTPGTLDLFVDGALVASALLPPMTSGFYDDRGGLGGSGFSALPTTTIGWCLDPDYIVGDTTFRLSQLYCFGPVDFSVPPAVLAPGYTNGQVATFMEPCTLRTDPIVAYWLNGIDDLLNHGHRFLDLDANLDEYGTPAVVDGPGCCDCSEVEAPGGGGGSGGTGGGGTPGGGGTFPPGPCGEGIPDVECWTPAVQPSAACADEAAQPSAACWNPFSSDELRVGRINST